MNLNNRKTIRRNVSRVSRLTILIFAFTVLGGLLTGCHPCSIPGACAAPSATEMVAFIGDNRALYFDIPARKNYKRAELTEITILKVDVGDFAIPYWSMSKLDYTSEGKLASEAQDLPWPLRYGQGGALTKNFTQPKAIEYGKYRIDGNVRLYDEKGTAFFRLFGRFRYENGAVHDYSAE